MTARLENTRTYLLAMSSRWFTVPSANVPVNALVRMLWDPIAALEHMLEPHEEVAPDVTERSAPTHVNAATVLPEPFATSSAAASALPVFVPRQFSAPKIVKHTPPLSKTPKISIPPNPQTDRLRLVSFESVRTAKPRLPVKSQPTTVSAAPGEFSAARESVNEAPSYTHEDLTSPSPVSSVTPPPVSSVTPPPVFSVMPPQVNSVTRMIRGGPALTSLLGENIGKTSLTNPLPPPNAALPPSIEVNSPTTAATRAATRAVRSLRREANHNSALEPVQQSQTTIISTTPQDDAPTASPEPARAPQTLSTPVNHDELMEELEQRLTVEFLRHYGTSGV